MSKLARLPRVRELTALGPTSIYGHIERGLLPPPIKITSRCSAWPESEIEAVNRARIAGKNDDQIRELVRELVAARTQTSAA